MNKLPGMRIDWIEQLPQQERNDFREGFKRAWQQVNLGNLFKTAANYKSILNSECSACGVVNRDESCRNLLWDNKNKKW